MRRIVHYDHTEHEKEVAGIQRVFQNTVGSIGDTVSGKERMAARFSTDIPCCPNPQDDTHGNKNMGHQRCSRLCEDNQDQKKDRGNGRAIME